MNKINYTKIGPELPEYYFRRAINTSNEYLVVIMKGIIALLDDNLSVTDTKIDLEENNKKIDKINDLISKGRAKTDLWLENLSKNIFVPPNQKEKFRRVMRIYYDIFENEIAISHVLIEIGDIISNIQNFEDEYNRYLQAQLKLEVLVDKRAEFVNQRQNILSKFAE